MRAHALKMLSFGITGLEWTIYKLIEFHSWVHRKLSNGRLRVGFNGSARSPERFRRKAQAAADRGDHVESARQDEIGDQRETAEALAHRFGSALAARDYNLITGGCDGSPGEASRGFAENKTSSQILTGVRIGSLSFEQPANVHLDLVIYAYNFFIRLAMMTGWADGGVIFSDGGVGTELEVWIWLQLVQVTPWKIPLIFMSQTGHFDSVRNRLDELAEKGLYDHEQLDGWVHFVHTPEEAIRILDEFRDEKAQHRAAA